MCIILFSTPLFFSNLGIGVDMARDHGMVLALHLMRLLNSSRQFTHLITNMFDNLRSVSCMKLVHQELLVRMTGSLAR